MCKIWCFRNSRELNIFFYRNLKLFVPEWRKKLFFSAEERQVVLLASLVDVPGRQKKQKSSSHQILIRLSASKILARNLWLNIIFSFYKKLFKWPLPKDWSPPGVRNVLLASLEDIMETWKRWIITLAAGMRKLSIMFYILIFLYQMHLGRAIYFTKSSHL